jgi:hypothetical protein
MDSVTAVISNLRRVAIKTDENNTSTRANTVLGIFARDSIVLEFSVDLSACSRGR